MTTEELEKRAWLSRVLDAERNAQAWLAKLKQDRSFAADSCSGKSGNSTEEALIRLAETERHTQKKLAELVRIREEVTSAIETVPDVDLRTVLVWRYLKYLTFEQIADKMHYTVRNIQYKHKAALDKLFIDLHSEK